MVEVPKVGKGGLVRLLLIGVVVSFALVVGSRLASQFGLAGVMATAGILVVTGMVVRKFVGGYAIAFPIAAGLVLAQHYVTPMVANKFRANSDAPQALTASQVADPIIRSFR